MADNLEPTQDATDTEEQPTFQDRPLEQHPELVNLALEMDEEELAEISATVIEEFTLDDTSRDPWLEMHAMWVKVYNQIDKPKRPPWTGSSEETLPILAEACNHTSARLVRAFLAQPEVVKAVPTGHVDPQTLERCDRVGSHMSWQVSVKDKSYFRNKDRLFNGLPIHGSVFTKTYRDPVKRRNVTENVRAEDLVVPYGVGPRDIEDVERKTHIIWMSQQQGAKLAATKYFAAIPEPYEAGNTSPMQEATDKATGQEANQDETSQPCKILEQHRFLDLDDDGLEEPYIVTVCAQSEAVLRISIRYSVYGEDVVMKDGQGMPMLDPKGQPVIAKKKGEASNYKEPLEYFTHYVYIENPDGFYGLGLGHMLGSTNLACNKMTRQIIDAATLQNTRTGFIDKRLGLKKGTVEIEIGKMQSVDAMTEDIKKGIYILDFPGPSQALIHTLEMLKQSADRFGGSTDILTGAPEKVLQPTTIMALIDQGLVPYTAVQLRVHNAFEQELQKLFRLNRIYLDEKEYFAINDLQGSRAQQVFKDDYADDLQVMPAADIGQTTQHQRLAKAEAEWKFYKEIATTPAAQGAKPINMWNEAMRYFKTIGTYDIETILPKPPEVPPPHPPSKDEVDAHVKMATAQMQADTSKMAETIRGEVALLIARIRAEVDIETAKMKAMIPVNDVAGNGQTGQPGYPQGLAGAPDNTMGSQNLARAVQLSGGAPPPGQGPTGGPPQGPDGGPPGPPEPPIPAGG